MSCEEIKQDTMCVIRRVGCAFLSGGASPAMEGAALSRELEIVVATGAPALMWSSTCSALAFGSGGSMMRAFTKFSV
jgi:hypothetical protein